jgi:hypothetical protein
MRFPMTRANGSSASWKKASEVEATVAAGTGLKETSANHSADRSGDSGERRKHLKTEQCGFLPKTATPVLQRSLKEPKSG